MNENNPKQDLEALKTQADNLGVDYAKNIGFENLEKKVKGALTEKQKMKVKEPKKMRPQQIAKMKATSLSKVRIVNLDRENAGATTVYSGVHTMTMDIARVIPLNMDIALEEALIKDIEKRKMLISEPVVDSQGNKTGNFKIIEAPMYAITRYNKK